MSYVIRIVEQVGNVLERFHVDAPQHLPPDTYRVDTFVKAYDPHAHEGRGFAEFTHNIDEAIEFADVSEAFTFYRQSHGERLDGKPNRPLTAFTVEVMPKTDEVAKARAKARLRDAMERERRVTDP